jgi:DNA-binding response OmpR family regulator
LVIEDNPDIQDILSYVLNSDGHEVISGTDSSFVKTLDETNPDLILLDEILSDAR